MVKDALKRLTGKKNVYLMDRWVNAVGQALERCYEASSEGFSSPNTILVPDQAGRSIFLAQKDKFNLIELKTHLGSVLLTHLRAIANEKSMVLMSSLGGFFAKQPMREIDEICKIKNTLLINDISGSIGTYDAEYGDILVCDFKPLGFECAFIACDEKLNIKESFDVLRYDELYDWLDKLNGKILKIKELSKKVKEDLKEFEVVHRESESLVVVVRYRNDEDKDKMLKYCEDNKFEYKLCPKYIRLKEKAISIEVKNGIDRTN